MQLFTPPYVTRSIKLEYVWLDGTEPEPYLRSKTKVIYQDHDQQLIELLTTGKHKEALEHLPDWSFDGSSTEQADTAQSDVLLKPVRAYPDPERQDGYLVLCEVYTADGTPHDSNTRHQFGQDDPDLWLGFEQEYLLVDHLGKPYGFPEGGYPPPQGMYYCGVGNYVIDGAGHGPVARVEGRSIVEYHLDLCRAAGIQITGINAEVLLGQWEYQIFGQGLKACDDMQIARYLLYRTIEGTGAYIHLGAKPISGDWNGSGCHINFSNSKMRKKVDGYMTHVLETFSKYHQDHLEVYGSGYQQRLSGHHETQHFSTFNWAKGARNVSIRIPVEGSYAEDRRPGSNLPIYLAAGRIHETLSIADQSWEKRNR